MGCSEGAPTASSPRRDALLPLSAHASAERLYPCRNEGFKGRGTRICAHAERRPAPGGVRPRPRRAPPSRRRHEIGTLRAVETILSILQIAISVLVVFLVLMHSGKDAGLSGAFGVGSGAGPLGGGSLVERNLNRWTIFFSVLFFVNAIVLLKRPWA